MQTTAQKSSETPGEPKYYSPEEYLALEAKANDKHEYRDGAIVPGAGGTTNHNEIASNLCTYFKLALRGQGYRVFISDVRLWIPRDRQYTYPDLMVIQGEPIYKGKDRTTVINPMLIAEVLSQSTQDYDKGTKFDYYRSIPELQEYILVDQYRYYVQKFTKNIEGKWVLSDIEGQDKVLDIESLNVQVSLEDLYDNVRF